MSREIIAVGVEHALETAPLDKPIDYAEHEKAVAALYDHASRTYDDYTRINKFRDNTGKVYAGEVISERASDIPHMLDAVTEITGVQNTFMSIEDLIEHETDHADAAVIAGAEQCWYGIKIVRTAEETFRVNRAFMRPFFTGLNALQAASVYARPLVPSVPDLEGIQECGYFDLSEVDRNIVAWNERHPNDVLLRPRSQLGRVTTDHCVIYSLPEPDFVLRDLVSQTEHSV